MHDEAGLRAGDLQGRERIGARDARASRGRVRVGPGPDGAWAPEPATGAATQAPARPLHAHAGHWRWPAQDRPPRGVHASLAARRPEGEARASCACLRGAGTARARTRRRRLPRWRSKRFGPMCGALRARRARRARAYAGAMARNPHAEHLQELLAGLNEPQREAVTHGEGPLLDPGGGGQRQDARADAPDRAPDLHRRGAAERDPRDHVHEQGREGDGGAGREAAGAGDARDVADDLPRGLRADPARGGRAPRLHAPVHDLRPGRRAAADQALRRCGRGRPQALHAGRDPQPDLGREEPPAQRLGPARDGRGVAVRGDARRRLRPLRARPAAHERDGLRRPAVPHGQPARAVRGRARALPERLPPRARRRVPGHQLRAVPDAAAARRRRAPGARARAAAEHSRTSQPRGGGRRLPVDLLVPRCRGAQHPRLPAGLPGRARGQARAELPLERERSCAPPTP